MGVQTVVIVVALAAIALVVLALLFALALSRSAAAADERFEPLLAELSRKRLRALGAAAAIEVEPGRIQAQPRGQRSSLFPAPPLSECEPTWALSRHRTWRQPSSV